MSQRKPPHHYDLEKQALPLGVWLWILFILSFFPLIALIIKYEDKIELDHVITGWICVSLVFIAISIKTGLASKFVRLFYRKGKDPIKFQ